MIKKGKKKRIYLHYKQILLNVLPVQFKINCLMLLNKFSVAAAKDFNFKINILNSGQTGCSCQ